MLEEIQKEMADDGEERRLADAVCGLRRDALFFVNEERVEHVALIILGREVEPVLRRLNRVDPPIVERLLQSLWIIT